MNSKTNKATTAQAGALAEFACLREVLATTHTEIPALLARQRDLDRALGLNETDALRAQLEDVVQQRQAAIRRRSASIAAIVEMEATLQGERARADAELRAYAVEALAAFSRRHDAAIAALQSLWGEADMLSQVLRCSVPARLPVKLVTSPIDGTSRAVPVRSGGAVPALDAKATELGAQLDRADEALSLIGAIRQARAWEAHHHQLAMGRGTATEHSGVYRVMLPFHCQTDGIEFQPGELVDSTLLGSGMLHRLMTGRHFVQPVGLEAA